MEINEEEILKDIIDHVESINELSDLKIALLMFISKEDTIRCLHSNYPFDTFIYDIFRIFLKDRELAQKVFNKTHDNV